MGPVLIFARPPGRTAPPRGEGAPVADLRHLWATPAGRPLVLAAAALLVATVVGLIALWPGDRPDRPAEALGGPTLGATVTAARDVRCPGPNEQRCGQVSVRVEDGRDSGRVYPITLGPVELVPDLESGDAIRVHRNEDVDVPPGAPEVERYAFADVDRRTSMLWLAGIFAALAIALAGRRGVLAIVGFALSLLLVVKFLVPALLEGSAPVLVALVVSLAVMFVTLGLTYGVSAASLAAALGIAASLLLGTLLARAWVSFADLDGRTGELSSALVQQNSGVSLQGVVIAGMVIGALGVLADNGVTQASAVLALRRSNPRLGAARLYREAFTVGRDHFVAMIHTLVLAYVGAALPLILVLSGAHVPITDALNFQDMAEAIVTTLVGAIALLASLPLTTGLAAVLVARVPAGALGSGAHEHAH